MVLRRHWTHAVIDYFCGKRKEQELEVKEEIMEAKYEKTKIEKTAKLLDHLNHGQHQQVLEVLKTYEDTFQRTWLNLERTIY